MSDFILEYDILESIARNSRSLGKRAEEYSQSLESKIIYAIGNVTGTSSGYLSSASDSVRDKINVLIQKSEAFYHFAEQVSNLLEVAERIDREVADAIATQSEYFLDHHESLRLSDWKIKLLNLLVDLKNSIPLLRTIADLLDGLDALLESMDDTIRHWYECEGGKYILEAIGSVAFAVVAVATFVAAFPVSGFFALYGAIGAGIAAVNSVVNVATSFEAAGAAVNDNPAWAMIYGKQDKLSDVLRQTNFGNGMANNLSNIGAGGLDTVETFCDVVGFVGMGADALKFFKGDAFKLLKNKGSLDFSDLKNLEKNGIVDSKSIIKLGYKNLKDDIKSLDKVEGISKGLDVGMFRKAKNPISIEPMPKGQLQKIVKGFKRQGGIIQMDDATDLYLQSKKAEAITYNENTILLSQTPGRASVFEELIHATQYRQGLNDGSTISRIKNEIAAQEMLLKNSKAYKLTPEEIKQTQSALVNYIKELEELLGGS